jgi:hypothetical protein
VVSNDLLCLAICPLDIFLKFQRAFNHGSETSNTFSCRHRRIREKFAIALGSYFQCRHLTKATKKFSCTYLFLLYENYCHKVAKLLNTYFWIYSFLMFGNFARNSTADFFAQPLVIFLDNARFLRRRPKSHSQHIFLDIESEIESIFFD